jgi:hypothetical protein
VSSSASFLFSPPNVFFTFIDSVIFDYDEAKGSLEEQFGDYLNLGSPVYGAMKDEMKGKPIDSFISLSSKNYSLKDVDGRETVKVRGFTLKHKAAIRQLNFDNMKRLMEAWIRGEEESVQTRQFSMKISRKDHSVKNSVMVKTYRNNCFDKRWILDKNMTSNPCVNTIPFGAKHDKFEDIVQ